MSMTRARFDYLSENPKEIPEGYEIAIYINGCYNPKMTKIKGFVKPSSNPRKTSINSQLDFVMYRLDTAAVLGLNEHLPDPYIVLRDSIRKELIENYGRKAPE